MQRQTCGGYVEAVGGVTCGGYVEAVGSAP